jgi:hypothetical protein
MSKVHVYVAGPYTGNEALNVKVAIECANDLFSKGYIPYVPHLTHFWHICINRPYEEWMAYCTAWLLKCDCLYRLPGASPGADREADVANSEGMPVVYSLKELNKIFKGKK